MILDLLVVENGIIKPVTLAVTQVLVKNDVGTPICVAGSYGPRNTQILSVVSDQDFNDNLRKLGIAMTVICDTIHLPNAKGSRFTS